MIFIFDKIDAEKFRIQKTKKYHTTFYFQKTSSIHREKKLIYVHNIRYKSPNETIIRHE